MEMIIIVTILGRAQISMELVGSAKFRKREPENKTGGTDFACLTLARHPYYLRAWNRLISKKPLILIRRLCR